MTTSTTLDVGHPGKGLSLGKGLSAASTAGQALPPHCAPQLGCKSFLEGGPGGRSSVQRQGARGMKVPLLSTPIRDQGSSRIPASLPGGI